MKIKMLKVFMCLGVFTVSGYGAMEEDSGGPYKGFKSRKHFEEFQTVLDGIRIPKSDTSISKLLAPPSSFLCQDRTELQTCHRAMRYIRTVFDDVLDANDEIRQSGYLVNGFSAYPYPDPFSWRSPGGLFLEMVTKGETKFLQRLISPFGSQRFFKTDFFDGRDVLSGSFLNLMESQWVLVEVTNRVVYQDISVFFAKDGERYEKSSQQTKFQGSSAETLDLDKECQRHFYYVASLEGLINKPLSRTGDVLLFRQIVDTTDKDGKKATQMYDDIGA